MPNDMNGGGMRGRKTKVGRKLLRFPPTQLHGKRDSNNALNISIVYNIDLTVITFQPFNYMMHILSGICPMLYPNRRFENN